VSRPRRRAGLCTLLFAVALLLAAWGASAVLSPVGDGPARLIVVEQGQSVREVARALRQEGLIHSAEAFLAAAYLTGKWRRVQAGRHELEPSMSTLQILDALGRGSRRAWRWLTIPEGYTLRQIAARVEEQELASAADFLAQAQRPRDFEVSFPPPPGGLEGYLFPDTYRVDMGERAEDIIAHMLRRFEEVVWRGLLGEQPVHEGRSLQDIVILASLVEAEAKVEEERPIIAGVFMNRLARGQKLECDATVQYALGDDRKSRLLYEDLTVDSEYNTYLHPGLPPGPICSPGEASIRAALEPADVPYLFYVARPDGSHVFSRTFAEHQAAIARIRQTR